MADGLVWAKFHTLCLTDPDLEDLSLEDWARWAKLIIYMKAHGEEGVLELKEPSRSLLRVLDLSDFKEVEALCGRLPNVKATKVPEGLVVKFENWGEYQGPSDAAERMRRLRERHRNNEEPRSERSSEHRDVTVTNAVPNSVPNGVPNDRDARGEERRGEERRREKKKNPRKQVSRPSDRSVYLNDSIRQWQRERVEKGQPVRSPDLMVEAFESKADADGWVAADWMAKFRTFLMKDAEWRPVSKEEVEEVKVLDFAEYERQKAEREKRLGRRVEL